MGIQGLLPALADITKARHINHYRGKRAAVDAYVWLHKAAYQCSKELAMGQGLTQLISYCIKMTQLLVTNGVEPVIVFDGGKLGSKGQEEKERHEKRARAKKE